MKKCTIDFRVAENNRLSELYSLLKLVPKGGETLPEIAPGQFVQVEIPGNKDVFLRRPISVNYVDYAANCLWLLVRKAGKGTTSLLALREDDCVNLILPLGNGFTTDFARGGADSAGVRLLIGGGVGVAPLLYYGKILKEKNVPFKFLLGARSAQDLLELDEFRALGEVCVSTEDGSIGEQGFVTQHSVLNDKKISSISCCGPMPMMKAVAKIAQEKGIDCEVSLENVMACGLGACLCCVEDTQEGNVCVCKEGPVFNIKRLKW